MQQEANQVRVSETRQFAVESLSEMDSSIVEHSPPPNVIGRPALANLLAQVALALFLITFAVIGAGYRGSNAFIKTQLSVTILFMMAATSTLVSLRRQLPSQNVILASLLVMLTGLAVQAVGISMDIGFSLPH